MLYNTVIKYNINIMRKKFLCSLFLAASVSANAQLTVLPNGLVYAGDMPESSLGNNDLNGDLTLQLFGKGDAGEGAKIAFGDFGRRETWGYNVFIGEYEKENKETGKLEIGDSDKLWLHGKNGLYYTYSNAIDFPPLFYFDIERGKNFVFKCNMETERIYQFGDKNGMKEIQKLGSQIDKLQQLNAVSYKESRENTNAVKSRTTYGLVAQDLAQVYPDLVVKGDGGEYSIDYTGLIAVLIESVKEQQNTIEALKKEIKKAESAGEEGEVTANAAPKSDFSQAFLVQNTPNPFSTETVIEYFIPEASNSAQIIIYDMNGLQLKEYPINTNGKGAICVNGSELYAGMYLYALIVDGTLIDSKKMVLTK